MAKAPQFSDRKTLEAWLGNQPVDWSRVIALRAALRVLPLISRPDIEELDGELRVHLPFAVFRACLTAEARAENPDEPINTAAAHNAAYEAASYAESSAASSAANAIADTHHTASAKAAALAANDAAAADDAFGGAGVIWRSVSTDASLLAAGESPGKLRRQPLWLDGGAPKWSDEAWNDLKTSPFNQAAGFAPWIAWWEALLPREKHAAPRNIFGKELALKIVTQSDEWWGRAPAAVNKDIADWLSSRAPPMDKATKATKAKEIARLNNAYFAARAKTASQSVEKHLRTGGKGAGGGGADWVDALAELDRLLGGRK